MTSYSLVEMNEDGNEFEIHRLVQFSTKKWLELYDELDGWKGTYVTLMDDSYPMGLDGVSSAFSACSSSGSVSAN